MNRRNQKTIALTVLSLTALALFAVWLLRTPVAQNSSHAVEDLAQTSPVEEAASGAEKPAQKRTASATGDTGDDLQALERYKAINRYPPSTRRVSRDSHDLLNPGMRHERRQQVPNDPENPDPDWAVLLTADRYFVNGDEPAEIILKIWHGEQLVAPGFVELIARASDASGGARQQKLSPRRSSGEVTALFEPDKLWPDYAGPVRITARFAASGLMNQTGTLDFYFTGSGKIPAEFTGAVHDRLWQGDLVFDIGLDVQTAGRYRIEASLFDARGEPFGWARFDGTLSAGQQDVVLRYDGLLFHDTGATAPYRLNQLHGYRLDPSSRAGSQQMPPMELTYLTRSDYEMNQFRATARVSPRQQHMLELYEDALRRGVQLTQPQFTGKSP